MKNVFIFVLLSLYCNIGFAYYDSDQGRWISRDPIGTKGGLNENAFVNNNAINKWDYLGQSWTEVLTWFGEWVTGTGQSLRALGPNSNTVNDMKNAPHVKQARQEFYRKNARIKCCKDLKDYTNYKASFGLTGLFTAGLNSTRQFIGSYKIDIFKFGCVNKKCKIDFELTNTTSFKSFLYGMGPDWEKDEFYKPMSNVDQVIWWTEVYNAECP